MNTLRNSSLFLKILWNKKSIVFTVARIIFLLIFCLVLLNTILIQARVVPGYVPYVVRCVTTLGVTPAYSVMLCAPDADYCPPPPSFAPSETKTCSDVFHADFWNPFASGELEWRALVFENLFEKDQYIPIDESNPAVVTFHSSYPNSVDDKTLLGSSHNVFMGRVISKVGNKDYDGHPASQLKVEVAKNIKGNLKDTIIINEMGGMRNEVLYLPEASGGILFPGTVYIFAVRHNLKDGSFVLNPYANGREDIPSDSSQSIDYIGSGAYNSERFSKLTIIYQKEVLFYSDIAQENTQNSFESLSEEEKDAALSRATEAKSLLLIYTPEQIDELLK